MSNSSLFIFIIILAINAVVTRLLLVNLNYFLLSRGIYGIDVNKPEKVKIPEEGGVSITISLLLSFVLYAYIFKIDWMILFVTTTFLISLLGFVDHFRNIQPYPKFIYCAVIGTVFSIHVFQNIDLSMYESIILILGIGFIYSVSVNAFNVLAGFNGLEAGLTVISSATLGIYYSLENRPEIAGVLYLVMISYLVFWWLNKYPAKIFIGDSGTLVPASVYVGIAVITNEWIPVAFVTAPHLLNVLIKFLSTGVSSRSDHTPLVYRDGKLYLPTTKNYYSLIRLFLLSGPKSELQIVYFMYSVELLFSISFFVFIGVSK